MSIAGQQELQAALLRAIAALQPSGAMGEAVRYVTLALHRYAVTITPVDTGSQRAAQTPEVNLSALTGRLFYDPEAINPKGGKPSRYGPENEALRGGRYAVYQKTVDEAADEAVKQALAIIIKELL